MIMSYVIAASVTQAIGKDLNLYGWINRLVNVLPNMTNKLR